jgi:hypothetical protein
MEISFQMWKVTFINDESEKNFKNSKEKLIVEWKNKNISGC